MLTLKFDAGRQKDEPVKVLCLGAHADDIEIGCGGTILKLIQSHANTDFYWVVFGAGGPREVEATKSANRFLKGVDRKKIIIKLFRDGFFPFQGYQIKELFEAMKLEFKPDLIFTHYRHDLHQDHRLISDLTWNTFRDHFILEYEIPKYDGDLGSPNLFVHLDETTCRRKVRSILELFRTQAEKHWFTEDTFFSLMRIRGLESASRGKYAEGYYCRKSVVAF